MFSKCISQTHPCCRRTVCDWERRSACAKCTSDGCWDVHLSCKVFETIILHLFQTCRARVLIHLSFTSILHLSCKGPPDWGAGGEGHQAWRAGDHHGCHCQDDHDYHGIVRMIIRGSKRILVAEKMPKCDPQIIKFSNSHFYLVQA